MLNSDSASSSDPMQAAEARMRRALGLDGEQLRARAAPERTEQMPRVAERFSPNGHKRRFVHDGEVPVTVVHGLVSGRRDHTDGNANRNGGATQPTNRLEVAEAALAAEIATRERIERTLQEAQAAVHDLRTKLGHADLARQEAVEALRREREAIAALQSSLQNAESQLAAARDAQAAAEQALAAASEPAPIAPAFAMPDDEPITEAPRPRRGRKPRVETAPADVAPAATAARKPGRRPRVAEAAPTREPKPIRWWLTPRGKKKR